MNPNAYDVFRFGDCLEFRNHPKFSQHARLLIDMIDCVVAFLGPNLDSIEDYLLDLGARHVRYGVRALDIPAMGQAAIVAMKQVLGKQFTESNEKDWDIIFQFVSEKMVEGMKR